MTGIIINSRLNKN